MPLIPRQTPPKAVDTVIIGNGPSALVLSYILSGHIPFYTSHHHDQHLHDRLVARPLLLDVDSSIYDHLRSSLKYSTQALPLNVLLDTLLRPDGDSSEFSRSCIEWRYCPDLAVDHVVLGDSPRAGGQWADNPVHTLSSIETLSYAEQLSLPGYTMAEFWLGHKGEPLPALVRPSRASYAEYLAAYPAAVGIEARIQTSQRVSGIMRLREGFHIASHGLDSKHVVLASGTFNISLAPPSVPRTPIPPKYSAGPVLIVGSGFTAADLIISTPTDRKIIHVFNWDPENRPSPLKACHAQAYPEYAWIYRQMKLAAARQGYADARTKLGKFRSRSTCPEFAQRDWIGSYMGFANARIISTGAQTFADKVTSDSSKPAIGPTKLDVCLISPGQTSPAIHTVGSIHYATGRRGSLSYLSPSLLTEMLPTGLEKNEEALYRLHHLSDSDPWTGDSDSPLPSQNASFTDLSLLHNLQARNSQDISTNSSLSFPSPLSLNLPYRKHSSPTPNTHSATEPSFTPQATSAVVSGRTLRPRIEASPECDLELAPGVFVIGSLAGDSLVRYAAGGCCQVAGRIMGWGRK